MAGAGCAGAERRARIGRVLPAGMLESRNFAGLGCCGAGTERLFGIELPRPGRAQPRGTGRALPRPHRSCGQKPVWICFRFLKHLWQPESRKGGRGNHWSAQPAATRGCARPLPVPVTARQNSPAQPRLSLVPSPSSSDFFAVVLLVLTLSSALPGPPAHPARADPELLLSLRFAEPPDRRRGTGAVPVPKSQQR